jgi:DNA-binding Xre family transcriptional regulator
MYDFREIIKREHDFWIDSLKITMQMKKITYQDLAEVLGITKQAVYLKVIKKKSPITAIEKEILNQYFKIKMS